MTVATTRRHGEVTMSLDTALREIGLLLAKASVADDHPDWTLEQIDEYLGVQSREASPGDSGECTHSHTCIVSGRCAFCGAELD
jgi:hypothetical protein